MMDEMTFFYKNPTFVHFGVSLRNLVDEQSIPPVFSIYSVED